LGRLWKLITSTRFSGIYLLLFAISIAVATFIENDFGTSAANKWVFRSLWFEVLLGLFALSIFANMLSYRLIDQKKWSTLLFHLSILIILLGSAVTRYFGEEGMLHVSEGSTSSVFLSAENFLNIKVQTPNKLFSVSEPIQLSSLGRNSFEKEYGAGDRSIIVRLKNYTPNPTTSFVDDSKGKAIVKIVFAGQGGREEYMISEGERESINGVEFNFSRQIIQGAFNIYIENDSLLFISDKQVNRRIMATQTTDDLVANSPHLFIPRSMYSFDSNSFVLGDYRTHAIVSSTSSSKKVTNESLEDLELEIEVNNEKQVVHINGRKGELGKFTQVDFRELNVQLSYGAKEIKLPFSIRCNDFILEKYPGTENPSSYASEVTLFDTKNTESKDFRIYMNHILSYDGYRFFQSSYDPDESGTYLSVNHDFWGTWITYVGYLFLTVGMIWTLFSRKSRYRSLIAKLNASLIFLIFTSFSINAQSVSIVSKEHAQKFGSLLVQDYNGRIKPINSYTSEIFRKISKKESNFDLTSDQLFLSMIINPSTWTKEKIIKLPDNPELKIVFGTKEDMIAYDSFFNEDGSYKLENQVRMAQMKNPKDQGTFDKALIKVDEKLNILNMVFNGNTLRIFPNKDKTTGSWISAADLQSEHVNHDLHEIQNLLIEYLTSIQQGNTSGDYQHSYELLNQIKSYQELNGGPNLPSKLKIQSELFLNQLNLFNRLIGLFAILAIGLTSLFLFLTIKANNKLKDKLVKSSFWILFVAFGFYSLGLVIRWYISGRAPWSNGYESMIYIGWTTLLAGLFFSRKSLGGLAATSTLCFIILLVASMSWLDPEITPLVPVLKSYWLTIHVSLEAGSYGFLLLGAVISMMNMTLLLFCNQSNKNNILKSIKELSIISEITLLVGLTMISIGTYLGGVWANESWGRYWVLDAKDAWALVTILVYSFILHMRFIPKLQ